MSFKYTHCHMLYSRVVKESSKCFWHPLTTGRGSNNLVCKTRWGTLSSKIFILHCNIHAHLIEENKSVDLLCLQFWPLWPPLGSFVCPGRLDDYSAQLLHMEFQDSWKFPLSAHKKDMSFWRRWPHNSVRQLAVHTLLVGDLKLLVHVMSLIPLQIPSNSTKRVLSSFSQHYLIFF